MNWYVWAFFFFVYEKSFLSHVKLTSLGPSPSKTHKHTHVPLLCPVGHLLWVLCSFFLQADDELSDWQTCTRTLAYVDTHCTLSAMAVVHTQLQTHKHTSDLSKPTLTWTAFELHAHSLVSALTLKIYCDREGVKTPDCWSCYFCCLLFFFFSYWITGRWSDIHASVRARTHAHMLFLALWMESCLFQCQPCHS